MFAQRKSKWCYTGHVSMSPLLTVGIWEMAGIAPNPRCLLRGVGGVGGHPKMHVSKWSSCCVDHSETHVLG